MIKNMKIVKQEDYLNLLQECVALLSERKFDLSIRDLEWRHELGNLIENSEIYKNSENKTELIKKLASDLGVSSPLLYQCLEFYRKFNDFDAFIQRYNNNKKSIKWSEVRLMLVENPTKCEHSETYTETVVIYRVKCSKCDKTLKEEKSKTL